VRAALIGFPASGKTTLFQILTGSESPAGHHHEDQLGVVRVPDPRLDRLSVLVKPKKTTPVAHEIVDPAVPFPEAGPAPEGRPEKDPYVALRTADVLVAVVRAFADPAVPHSAGSVDPERDRKRIEDELVLADLVLADTRLERIEKLEKVGKKTELPGERALLQHLHQALDRGEAIRTLELSRDEAKGIRGYGFLSHKPLLVVYNVGEAEEASTALPAARPGFAAVALAARAELEVSRLAAEERAAFREALGLSAPAPESVISTAEGLLGLLTFFTVGPPEARAWQVGPGASLVDAAGKIHTDLARGFIRAEVVAWDRLLEAGSLAHARERGWVRTEGRDAPVVEGDVVHVLFKV
jgi:GTP-binding protein YchF